MLKFFSLFGLVSAWQCAPGTNLDDSFTQVALACEKTIRQALDDVLVGLFKVLNDLHNPFWNAYAAERYAFEKDPWTLNR